MIKPYNKYKDSGVEWLGLIPENWYAARFNRGIELLTDYEANGSFDSIKKNVEFSDEKGYAWYVRATDLENLSIDDEDNVRWVNESTYKFLSKTSLIGKELLIAKRGEIGKVYIMPETKHKATLAPNLYLVRLNKKLDPKFTWYFFESYLGKIQLVLKNRSVTIGAIYKDDLKEVSIVFPPNEDQSQIAKYLDYQTEIINEIIQKKEKLILLLKEKRQAIINEAITRGLDPTSKMKDSGIEWLGQIPESWGIAPLRYLTRKVGSGVTPKGGNEVYTEKGVIFIRSQNVHFDGLRLDDVVRIDYDTHEKMSNSKVLAQDVLLNITGASIGRCCLVNLSDEMNVNQHVCIIRPNKIILSEFLNYVLQSTIGQNQVKIGTTGGNREGLTFEAIKDFIIPVPKISDQLDIVIRVEASLKQFVQIESMNINQIEKLKEYRQSIISEAVTGKVDVRDWQPPVN